MSTAFYQTIQYWTDELKRYNFTELCAKPSPSGWSLGQVYMHLIENTEWFLEQVKICLASKENGLKEPTEEGKTMLLNNDFPDEIIEGPPENVNTQQPRSIEEIQKGLDNLRKEIHQLSPRIAAHPFTGRTKHPGLGYFNGAEWFQFAEMHFRHHLRQKKRIDNFLASYSKKDTSNQQRQ